MFIHLISGKVCLWSSALKHTCCLLCICMIICVCSSMYACVGRGYICTGREPVNKSVWGLGVWGWNMVPGMWSNVKNSATPGNNKSPDVASPQNKYTPPYKSSIWTVSRRKDAPNTSPTHPNTHKHVRTHTQRQSHTAVFVYTFIYLFVELNESCLWGIGKYIYCFLFCLWMKHDPHPPHTPLKSCLCLNGRFGWGGRRVRGLWIWRFN